MSQLILEENFVSIKRTCENRQIGCEYLNSTQLQSRYPILLFPPLSECIFHNQSGYINVTTLMMGLLRIINQNENNLIQEKEEFLSLNFDNETKVVTDRGVLYASRKVLLVPGPYTKNVSHLINFDLNIKLRKFPIYYFGGFPNGTLFPTWFAQTEDNLQCLFSGFPISSDYIVVSARFSKIFSEPLKYP
jgi:hypothetical protein